MIFLITYGFRFAKFIVSKIAAACSALNESVNKRLKKRKKEREEKRREEAKEKEVKTEDIYKKEHTATRKGSFFRRLSLSTDEAVEVTVAESHNPMHANTKRHSVSETSPTITKRPSLLGGLGLSLFGAQLPPSQEASDEEAKQEAKKKGKETASKGEEEGNPPTPKVKRRSSMLLMLSPRSETSDVSASETKAEGEDDKLSKENSAPRRSFMGGFIGRKGPVEEPAAEASESGSESTKGGSRSVMTLFSLSAAKSKDVSGNDKGKEKGKDKGGKGESKSSRERAREVLDKKKSEAKQKAEEMRARGEKAVSTNIARAKDLGKRGAHKVSKRAAEAKQKAVAMVPLKYRVMAKAAMKTAGVA